MLHTMYYAEEVRKVEGFGAPDVELKDAEVKVAHQLIEALADEWDPEKYKDTFQENSEEADRSQTRRRRSRRRRETEETGASCRSDGRPEAEPGPDGRQEEARSHHQVGGSGSGSGKIPPRTRMKVCRIAARCSPPPLDSRRLRFPWCPSIWRSCSRRHPAQLRASLAEN